MKSDEAYKSISEVAKLLDLVNSYSGKLNTHTIRYWEKEFKQIKPKIFSGKRRYYDKKTIDIIKKIKFLLKVKGLTINGAKKYLDNEKAFNLDENYNSPIKNTEILKTKVKNISKIVKKLKIKD